MTSATDLIKAFFERWERIVNTDDVDLTASQYADPFMFADPSGVRVVDRSTFRAALPRRREFFQALGHRSTSIVSLKETALDDRYVMVRVRFQLEFESAAIGRRDVRVESTFILRARDGSLEIVFHVEHEDLQNAMRTRGLLPADA
jgi:ketosteroid isomerase-like protein